MESKKAFFKNSKSEIALSLCVSNAKLRAMTILAAVLIFPAVICYGVNDYNSPKQRRRLELPQAANQVFVTFQKALKDCNWNGALGYCSEKVKSKAGDYNSAEEFFDDVVPVEKITELKAFKLSGSSGRDENIRYRCEIDIKDPNYKWPVDWVLEVCRKGERWEIEFPTKPLNIWLKHAVLTSKVINSELKTDTEKCKIGYEYILTPLAEKFTIGKAMPFRIEMKNISNESLPYTKKNVTVHNPMIITGPDGEKVEYLAGPCSIVVTTEFTEPNETVILAESFDVGADYHIVKPDKYSFQFRGDYGVNSNTVEIEVASGELSAIEIITEKLKPIVPKDWILSRSNINDIDDLDMRAEKGISIGMMKKGFIKNPKGSVGIFMLVNPSEDFLQKMNRELELWGDSEWGPVYFQTSNAEEHWPEYKRQIKEAMGIR
ncbi:MAG: hypothetical protein A2Y10_19000 [Planctomycetes bacterium GWF2_41_51]|nr:MAG: hypothetical protein A2Y10_19000 [Planctomycetes bacterium GWF2_41_51]HBG27393.1 hypothetical protein [Phycisphaerales bacterium]